MISPPGEYKNSQHSLSLSLFFGVADCRKLDNKTRQDEEQGGQVMNIVWAEEVADHSIES